MSSFFMKSYQPSAFSYQRHLKLLAEDLISVHRYISVHSPRPGVDATAHGLRFFESLLPQPYGDIHRAHAVMTNHDDLIFGIKFLMSSRRHVAHGNQLRSLDPCGLKFPRLPHVEQGERIALAELRFHRFGSDFVVHGRPISPPTWAHAFP